MALLSKIHHKVNIIPVIAKADSFTPEECKEFKKLVMESLDANQIRYYTNESKEYVFPFDIYFPSLSNLLFFFFRISHFL